MQEVGNLVRGKRMCKNCEGVKKHICTVRNTMHHCVQRILPGKGSGILGSRMSADPRGSDGALSIWKNPTSQDKHSAP